MKTTFLKKMALPLSLLTLSACTEVRFSPNGVLDSASSVTGKVSYTEVVASGNKQVDFLIVLDDSNSMLPELKKLAAKMSSFADSLDASGIDWQMCLTTTRAVGGQWGTPLAWTSYVPTIGTPAYLLKKGSANLDTIFKKTISELEIGADNSSDERGIKAAYENFTLGNPNSGTSHSCYRPGAALSVIAISDEDERSVGGESSRMKPDDPLNIDKRLEAADLPENLVSQSRSIFGESLRFTFNSIIVKPGDHTCEASQDYSGSPSHEGFVYAQASQLTGGGIASICESDYAGTMNTFKDKIVNSLSQLSLRCVPDAGTLEVKVNGVLVTNYQVENRTLKFTNSLTEGTTIDLTYNCPGK